MKAQAYQSVGVSPVPILAAAAVNLSEKRTHQKDCDLRCFRASSPDVLQSRESEQAPVRALSPLLRCAAQLMTLHPGFHPKFRESL